MGSIAQGALKGEGVMRYYVNFNYPSRLRPDNPRKVHLRPCKYVQRGFNSNNHPTQFENLEDVQTFYGDNYICCWICCDGKLNQHTSTCRQKEALKNSS